MNEPHHRLSHASTAAANDARRARAPASLDDGEQLLIREGLRGLRDALAGAQAEDASGWIRFWRGYVLQFDDLALAWSEWLRAEELFAANGDAAGLELAACGLVQCTHFDERSYQGFDVRARLAAGLTVAAGDHGPLALFRIGARMLVAATGYGGHAQAVDDVDRAFAALASRLDAEVRLRCAAAALQVVGLSADRARAADFDHAGANVAALAEVGDYSRAVWHMFVSLARWHDTSVAARVAEDLDTIERIAPHIAGGRKWVGRACLLRSLIALTNLDVARSRAYTDAAHRHLDPAYPRDYAMLHFLMSRQALIEGDVEAAMAHATMSLRKCDEAGAPASETTPLLTHNGTVQAALGHFDEAATAFSRAGELSPGANSTPCLCYVHLVHALRHLRDGSHDEARAELSAGFAHARSIDLTHFFRAVPRLAAALCGASLDLDADAAFARKVIAARALACPDLGISQWPWPLRLRTLGGFAIDRDDEPVGFGRKAPKRMLDVLRLVAALGGRQVDLGRVAATLWPDAEGDEARNALKAMLRRARALFGVDLLLVRDGQISFDEQSVWIDTWAFDHVTGRVETLLLGSAGTRHVDDGELERRRLQFFALYRGHFLGEGDVPAWAIAVRDRWRARFVRTAVLLGQRYERVGRPEAAIALYRAALEQDNLAEELYQRLIECHIARGENAQALHAYRRCRELLSIVLGLRPSMRTEALVARIPGR